MYCVDSIFAENKVAVITAFIFLHRSSLNIMCYKCCALHKSTVSAL